MSLYGRFEDMVDALLSPPPQDYEGTLTCADFFCGIGGFDVAARNLGLDVVFSCDINDDARRGYRHNFDMGPEGDINQLRVADVPDHDVLLAGFPCQPFSIIGRQQGSRRNTTPCWISGDAGLGRDSCSNRILRRYSSGLTVR